MVVFFFFFPYVLALKYETCISKNVQCVTSDITSSRGVARNLYIEGPIRNVKIEINDDEYHRCMDSLYF